MIQVFFFSPFPPPPPSSPHCRRPRPPRRPPAAEALFEMRREAGRGDAPAAGRAGHVPRRGGLQGLAEGVDPGEADGGGRGRRRGRRRGGGGGSRCCCCCGCGGLGVSVGGGDRGGARRRRRSDGGIGAAPLQRWRALQVHAGGRSRGRSGPPGTVGLDGDVGDELYFVFEVFFGFSKKRLRDRKKEEPISADAFFFSFELSASPSRMSL